MSYPPPQPYVSQPIGADAYFNPPPPSVPTHSQPTMALPHAPSVVPPPASAAVNPSVGMDLASTAAAVSSENARATNEVEVLPIGSGGEVGRSCVVVSYKGRKVMMDCGNHPAKSGLDSLPFFDSIQCNEIDLVLITHFHLDHCGALPYFCEQTNFKGRIFMTSATKAFYRVVMNDFLRIGNGADDIVNEEWLKNTMDRIETIEYHEEKVHNGIRFQPLNAGHVLGAAMFMIDIAGVKTLYTGDFSRVPDRHLVGAELPHVSPDILIAESTNGIHELESREEREHKFTTWVHSVVKNGGRCLVPVFALGRAQELLLILEEFWEEHRELHHVKIYYASSLAQRCMKMYQTFISAMNDRVKAQHANHKNPFMFQHIESLTDINKFEDSGPCVVLASPGMLQSGISLQLFERWCGDTRNGIIIAGYCVDGTIAKTIMSKPREVTTPDGRELKVKMKTIETVSFSAHSDGRQTRDFISALPGTQHVILVHGNVSAMENLKNKLQQDFQGRAMKVYTTRNESKISIPFTVQRTAKVMGELAKNGYAAGDFVNGVVLVSGQQDYSIVHPKDIPTFTGLNVSQVQQSMILPMPNYHSPQEVLEHLQSYFAQSEMFPGVAPNISDSATLLTGSQTVQANVVKIKVSHDVTVAVEQNLQSHTVLTIVWLTSRYNDLLADVTCIALTHLIPDDGEDEDVAAVLDTSAGRHRAEWDHGHAPPLPLDVTGRDRIFRVKCFHHMMSQFYHEVQTNLSTGNCTVTLASGKQVTITDCIEMELEDEKGTKFFPEEIERLKAVLKRVYLTLFPIPVDYGWCDCGQMHGEEPSE